MQRRVLASPEGPMLFDHFNLEVLPGEKISVLTGTSKAKRPSRFSWPGSIIPPAASSVITTSTCATCHSIM